MATRVSVIIPVYNAAKYLRQCLDSVRLQTLGDIEIICVNDGSTDESLSILEDYAKKDERVTIIDQQNAGPGAARNRGLEISRGEYLSFLDSDDFVEPTMLEKMYQRALAKGADITICRSKAFDSQTKRYEATEWSVKIQCLPPMDPFSYKDVSKCVFSFCYGWAWDKLFRAEFAKRNNLRFASLRSSEDLVFVFSALVKAKSITVMDDVLAYHRTNHGTSVSQTRENSWNCFYLAATALQSEIQSMGIYEEIEQAFINWALGFCLWNMNTIKGSARKELYDRLREEYFRNLGIGARPRGYFYIPAQHAQYLVIRQTPYSLYKSIEPVLRMAAQFDEVYRTEGLRAALRQAKDWFLSGMRGIPASGLHN